MRTRVFLAVFIGVALTVSAAAQTQITTGVIQGTAADATGAMLAGVTVEARNADTNLTRTAVSDTNGRFVFLQLPPGRYTVTYTLTGFATLVQRRGLEQAGGQGAVKVGAIRPRGLNRSSHPPGHETPL